MNILTLSRNQFSASFFALLMITSLLVSVFPVAFFVTEAANTDAVGTITIDLLPRPAEGTPEHFVVSFSGTGTLNLDGWTVEETLASSKLVYTFGAVSLNDGESFKVCGSSVGGTACDAILTNNTIWNNDGDTLVLKDGEGISILSVTYASSIEGVEVSDSVAINYAPVACTPQTNVEGPTGIQNANTLDYFDSVPDALADCDTEDGDIIELLENISIDEQITLDRPITLAGNGFTISPTFAKTDNDNNATIGIIGTNAVTVEDLTIDGIGGTELHGINVYVSTGVNLNNITTTNVNRTAIVVNGSDVTVEDITTSGSGWHAINAAPGSGVSEATILTVNGTSVHSEDLPLPHIYTDDTSKNVIVQDTEDQYEIVYEGPNPQNPAVDARAYRLKTVTVPLSETATVMMCKVDTKGNNLSDWQLTLLGDEVGIVNVVPDGNTYSIASVPAGEYVVKASGTYVYRTGPNQPADTTFSLRRDGENLPTTFGQWLPSSYWTAGYLGLQVNEVRNLWGTVFNPQHTYYTNYEQIENGSVNFRITDSGYGDNSGSLTVTLHDGQTGVTGGDGCVVFDDVPYGTYTVEEVLRSDWENVSGLGTITVAQSDLTITVTNRDTAASQSATLAITNPEISYQALSGEYNFTVEYIDDDTIIDTIQWAIRAGTCDRNTGTVAGNVDGFNTSSSFVGTTFSATFDIDTLPAGDYCFVVNPNEQVGEPDLRATQWFTVGQITKQNPRLGFVSLCELPNKEGMRFLFRNDRPIEFEVQYEVIGTGEMGTITVAAAGEGANTIPRQTNQLFTILDTTTITEEGRVDIRYMNEGVEDTIIRRAKDRVCEPILEITNPATDGIELTPTLYTFEAKYFDDDTTVDTINWAVKPGSCEAHNPNVNLLGFGTAGYQPATFDPQTGAVVTEVNLTDFENGDYCFVVNPEETGGKTDTERAVRLFTVSKPEVSSPVNPEITPPTLPDQSNNSDAIGTRFATRLAMAEPQPLVFGAATSQCGMLVSDYMRMGTTNDPIQVRWLQFFLVGQGYFDVAVTGVFDEATDSAVRAFQERYRSDILDPWVTAGILTVSNPSGWVYQLTRHKINNMVCPGSEPVPQLI